MKRARLSNFSKKEDRAVLRAKSVFLLEKIIDLLYFLSYVQIWQSVWGTFMNCVFR